MSSNTMAQRNLATVPTRLMRCAASTGLAVMAIATGSCAGDSSHDTGNPAVTAPRSSHIVTPTTGLSSTNPEVTTLEAGSPVSCTGTTATVNVRYTTLNTSTVAFLVDQTPVAGSPPASGSFDLSMPCDGNSHTIMLVAVGPSGQTVATKAVRTDRQG